ncbi:hypothetical protein FRX31_023846 [Thalictrum thalictroides]|uniref:Uncharacterized protein n=1 Tax=Thalictrum thalictroides TaxID=46969 RepID=A0A7J6VN86_THATH|nr:hypothetical protein FRX31_023846 [Thalictrum thalictroides]
MSLHFTGMPGFKKIGYPASISTLFYLRFLHILLDTRPQTQWRTLISPETVYLRDYAILYIAERWREISLPSTYYVKALPWKNLITFTCRFFREESIRFSHDLGIHCKKMVYLALCGRIGIEEASAVVENLLDFNI